MISGPVVIDASVAVEFLVDLRFAQEASTLFHALALEGDAGLWAPDLLYAESASALRRLVRAKALSKKAATRAVGQLLRLPLQFVGPIHLVERAFALGDSVTVYDATYVALAMDLDAPLVTTDLRLQRSSLAKQGRIVTLTEAIT